MVRWRCLGLREEVARRFNVAATERTIGKWLRKLDPTRLQPRPFHLEKDAAAQETFKKLREPCEKSPSSRLRPGRPAGGDLVSGRSQSGAERRTYLYLGRIGCLPRGRASHFIENVDNCRVRIPPVSRSSCTMVKWSPPGTGISAPGKCAADRRACRSRLSDTNGGNSAVP